MNATTFWNAASRVLASVTGVFIALLIVVVYVESQVSNATGGVTTNEGVVPLGIASIVGLVLTLGSFHGLSEAQRLA